METEYFWWIRNSNFIFSLMATRLPPQFGNHYSRKISGATCSMNFKFCFPSLKNKPRVFLNKFWLQMHYTFLHEYVFCENEPNNFLKFTNFAVLGFMNQILIEIISKSTSGCHAMWEWSFAKLFLRLLSKTTISKRHKMPNRGILQFTNFRYKAC